VGDNIILIIFEKKPHKILIFKIYINNFLINKSNLIFICLYFIFCRFIIFYI